VQCKYLRERSDQQKREHNRIRQNTEDKQKSEVKSLVCVVSLCVVTKCYGYSMTVLQLIVVQPDEYPINRFI
jgi:hypothetical protein